MAVLWTQNQRKIIYLKSSQTNVYAYAIFKSVLNYGAEFQV
jgi:hypothetical protein